MSKNQASDITAKSEDTDQSNQVNQPGNTSTTPIEESTRINKEDLDNLIKSFIRIGIDRALYKYLQLYKAEGRAL